MSERRSRVRGTSVPGPEMQAHLLDLRDNHGMTRNNIVRASGVSANAVTHIMLGRAQYVTASVANRLRQVSAADREVSEEPGHGTASRYAKPYNCRCRRCTRANTVAAQKGRRARGVPSMDLVSAKPARLRLIQLHDDNGLSFPQINALCSVGSGNLSRIHRGLQKRISAAVRDRILAISPDVANYDTRKELTELDQRGWTVHIVALATGISVKSLRDCLQGQYLRMRDPAPELIHAFYGAHHAWNVSDMWRIDAKLASGAYPQPDQSRATLIGLEHLLEQRIRHWLMRQQHAAAWADLDPRWRTLLTIRFSLNEGYDGQCMGIATCANRTQSPPQVIRARTRDALQALLSNPRTSIEGWEPELRAYMAHSGLRNL